MYKINEKYRNSRHINYNRWSYAPEVRALVNDLIADMKATVSNVRKMPKYGYNMITLQMELYHSYLTDNEQYIAYHQNKNHYNFKLKINGRTIRSRYNPNPHITYDYFIGCIKYLKLKGYIVQSDGGSFRDADGGLYGYLSRMRATDTLVALWNEYKLTPEMIDRFANDEVIKLKGPVEKIQFISRKTGKKRTRKYKPERPYYDDTNAIKEMRRRVVKYNLLLDRTYIDIDVECISQKDRDKLLDSLIDAKDKFSYSIDLGDKQVYRVFNNDKWDNGGRYYGAWWIGCPSVLRKYIRINSNMTCQLDYSGVHINLLYALEGLNFADLNTDAYELVENDPDRDFNKLILLTAFNAENAKDAARAVFDKARKEGLLKKFNLKSHQQIYDKLDLLRHKHNAVDEYIAKGYGSVLQYHDACILERIIKHFTDLKIPILTVHDAVICQVKHSEFVRDIMLQEYTNYINAAFKANATYSSSYPQAEYIFKLNTSEHNSAVSAIMMYLYSKMKNLFTPRGSIPIVQNSTIKLKQEELASTICNKSCKHSERAKLIASGKRIFLCKIKIEYTVSDGIAMLTVRQ